MADTWHFESKGHDLEVWQGGQLFTAYRTDPREHRPWFYPVNAPGGVSVTQEFNDPWPHHASLWLAHGNVNGHEVWLDGPDRGRIVHQGFHQREATEDQARFADRCEWLSASGQRLLDDERSFRFFARDGKRFIDAEFTLRPAGVAVVLGKTNHAFFSARVTTSISVDQGGRLENAQGSADEASSFAQPSPWCDGSGPLLPDGRWSGIAILDHPGNPWHPPPWFTRDYGFLSPTPFHWGEHEVPGDGTLHVKYRVVVHEGNASDADIAGEWERYAADLE